MVPEPVYKNDYVIGYSDVDFNKKLRMSTLFSYFQDTSSRNVDKLGIGVDALIENYSIIWVLTKMLVNINRIPSLNEKITIETWPHPPKKIEFQRDFLARDEKGNIVAAAISSWVLLDVNTREIKKSDILSTDYSHRTYVKERAIDNRLRKLKPFSQLETVYRKVIGYSDTDFNGHINNAKYIDYIMDCFPIEEHKKHTVKSIEVNYIKEVFPGDALLLYKDTSMVDSNMVYIEGVNESDQKPAFRAQLIIE